MQDDIALFLTLLPLMCLDIFLTYWTIDRLKDKKVVKKLREQQLQEPEEMEINWLPRMLIKSGIPRIFHYIITAAILFGVITFANNKPFLGGFMLGAYSIVFMTHHANYVRIKEVLES